MIRAALVGLLLATGPAWAERLEVVIDKSDQEMRVALDGRWVHRWPVSTARPGKVTPVGQYMPVTLKEMHYSTLYNNAPMPWSIFFHGNYAIHGTDQVARLGTPASAGCVRLDPVNAEALFGLVLDVGVSATRIVIRE